MHLRAILILVVGFLSSQIARADIATSSGCQSGPEALVSTTHSMVIGAKNISYTATVGYLEVASADQTAKACIFYTAYSVAATPGEKRPITFAFNGGPGSASVWLHLGFLGPMRVDLGTDGLTPPANSTLVPNESTLLDVSDIVMIDPVATGFTTVVSSTTAAADKFLGVKNDYLEFGNFVKNYLTADDRWQSPKFILGESYGGIRGPLLANYLQSQGVQINGLILISPALSMASLNMNTADNNTALWTFFPSYATTAWFHKTSAPRYLALPVDEVYNQAKAFAFSQLRDALDQGDDLPSDARARIIQQMVDFTGLDRQLIDQSDLQIDQFTFFTNLLRSSQQIIGRYDGRFVAPGSTNTDNYFDPSDQLISYAFTQDINHYLKTDLGFKATSPYVVTGSIPSWSDDSGLGDGGAVVTEIASSLTQDPHFQVFIASGYFDLACPMATVEYELSQLPGGTKLHSRITQKKYPSGHMVYVNSALLPQLKTDVASFIQSQLEK